VYPVAWGCLPWSRVCSFSLRALVFTFVASPCTNRSPFVLRLRVSFLVDSVGCPRVRHVFFLRCVALGLQHCTCSVVGASVICGVSSLSSFRRVDFVGPSVVSYQSPITCRSQCSCTVLWSRRSWSLHIARLVASPSALLVCRAFYWVKGATRTHSRPLCFAPFVSASSVLLFSLCCCTCPVEGACCKSTVACLLSLH